MPHLLVPRQWVSQPQYPVPINNASPLSKRMLGFVNGGLALDLVSGRFSTGNVGTLAVSSTFRGLSGRRYTSTPNGDKYSFLNGMPAGVPFTVFVLATQFSVGIWSMVSGDSTAASSGAVPEIRPNSSGQFRFIYSDGTNRSIVGGTIPLNTPVVTAVTVDGTTTKLYGGGVLQNSLAAGFVAAYTPTFTIGSGPNNTGFDGIVHACVPVAGALSASEVATTGNNLFQLLAPRLC